MGWLSAVPVVGGWIEKGLAARAKSRAVDMRVADKAKALRRTLAASFEDWPNGPGTKDDLIRWAHKLTRGFGVTDPALTELTDLRPEASHRVRRAVGVVRDEYQLAADPVNRAVKTTWQTLDVPAEQRVDEASLRRAFAHLRRC